MKGGDGGDEKEGELGAGSRFEARGYAAFLQNAGIVVGVFSQGLHSGLVCDAHSGHGIRYVVGRAWYRKYGERARYRKRGRRKSGKLKVES